MPTYYLRTDGNDGNTGTADTAGGAWLTPAYAWTQVSDNDTISVNAGTYADIEGSLDHGLYMNPTKIVDWIAVGTVIFQPKNDQDGVLYFRGSTKATTFTGFTIDAVGENTCAWFHTDTGGQTLTDCILKNAAAQDVNHLSTTGTITLEGCTFESTTAYNINTSAAGDIIANNCTISGNAATSNVYMQGTGTKTISNSTISATDPVVIFDMKASADLVLSGNTISGQTSINRIIKTNAGKTGSITLLNETYNTGGTFATNPLKLDDSTYDIDIQGCNFNLSNATIAANIIKIEDQGSVYIDNNTITTVSEAVPSTITITSTDGTDMAVEVTNNEISQKSTVAGYGIGVGLDASGGGDNDLDGAIITGNKLYGAAYYDAAKNPSTHGLFLGYAVDGIIQKNYVNGMGYGVVIKSSGDAYTSGGIANNVFIDNIFDGVLVKGVQDVPVVNNTIIHTIEDAAIGIEIVKNGALGDSDDCIIENNIIYSSITAGNFVAIEIGVEEFANGYTCDYNDIYSTTETTNFLARADGTSYTTLATWRTKLGDAANSINSDPKLRNNYAIKGSSPCKGSGVDLGSSYDKQLKYNASFPNPATVAQSGSWNMGAYSSAPSGDRRRRR